MRLQAPLEIRGNGQCVSAAPPRKPDERDLTAMIGAVRPLICGSFAMDPSAWARLIYLMDHLGQSI